MVVGDEFDVLVACFLFTTMSDLRRRQILAFSAIAVSLVALGATICAHEEDLLHRQRRKERRRRKRIEKLKEGQMSDAPERARKKRPRDVDSDVGEAETRHTKLLKTDTGSNSKHNFLWNAQFIPTFQTNSPLLVDFTPFKLVKSILFLVIYPESLTR